MFAYVWPSQSTFCLPQKVDLKKSPIYKSYFTYGAYIYTRTFDIKPFYQNIRAQIITEVRIESDIFSFGA